MRNLKRALSMLLSSTMVLGMVVMGGSAAGYQDVDDSYNKEAIEVLQAVGIMTGDENGNFNPDGTVTRNQMAVIMSNLMAYNVATYKGTSPFTDVPEWAEPYVAACYTNGITAGISATEYGGDQEVTTSQAALMIMKALGYFQFQSDFGSDWQLSTITQGNKIDLFDDVDSGVKEAMSRNDVAQLVLNGLESGTVEAETSGTITVGDTTIVSGVKYNYVTSTQDYARTIDQQQSTTDNTDARAFIVELGEKLYMGNLRKDQTVTTGGALTFYEDVFGRPATRWEYQSQEIGVYADKADYSFTSKVTAKALYDAVGRTAAENYVWRVFVDGNPTGVTPVRQNQGFKELVDNKTDTVKEVMELTLGLANAFRTGNGVRTDVFVDPVNGYVHLSLTHYYAAEVYTVDEDKGVTTLSDLGNGPAELDDEFDTTDFEEDQIVVYSYTNGEIQEIYAATSMEGTVTATRVKTDESDGDYYIVDGTKYNYNLTVPAADRLETENVNNNMVGYLDQYGYAIYIDEAAVSYDYAYVLSMGNDGDIYGGNADTWYARLVLTDGTVVKAETDEDDGTLNNRIVSYTVDKNGVYTLSDRSDAAAAAITDINVDNGIASFTINGNRYTANSSTVFIIGDSAVDDQDYNNYDFTVYTGVKNMPNIANDANAMFAIATETNSNVAKVVYVQDADVSGAGSVYFVRANVEAKLTNDSELGRYREIDAVVDGEVTTLKVKEGTTAEEVLCGGVSGKVDTLTQLTPNEGLYLNDAGTQRIVALESITYNADGLVTNVRLYDDHATSTQGDGFVNVYTPGTDKATKETVMLGGTEDGVPGMRYAWYDDVAVVRWDDYAGEFKVSTISSVKTDLNDRALAVLADDVLSGLCIVEYKSGLTVENGGIPQQPAFEIEVPATDDGSVIVAVDLTDVPAVEDIQNPQVAGNTLTFNVPVNENQAQEKARAASEEYKYTLVWEGTLNVDGDVSTQKGESPVVNGVATIEVPLPASYTKAVFTLTSATLYKELVEEIPEDSVAVSVTADNAEVELKDEAGAEITTSAKQNSTITMTVTAAEGYKVDSVTVNGKTITAVNGVYTIEVDTADIAIVVNTVEDVQAPVDDLPYAPGTVKENSATSYTVYVDGNKAKNADFATYVQGLIVDGLKDKVTGLTAAVYYNNTVTLYDASEKVISNVTVGVKEVFLVSVDGTPISWAVKSEDTALTLDAAKYPYGTVLVEAGTIDTGDKVGLQGALSVNVTANANLVKGYELDAKTIAKIAYKKADDTFSTGISSFTDQYIALDTVIKVTGSTNINSSPKKYIQLYVNGEAEGIKYEVDKLEASMESGDNVVYPELTITAANADGKVAIEEKNTDESYSVKIGSVTAPLTLDSGDKYTFEYTDQSLAGKYLADKGTTVPTEDSTPIEVKIKGTPTPSKVTYEVDLANIATLAGTDTVVDLLKAVKITVANDLFDAAQVSMTGKTATTVTAAGSGLWVPADADLVFGFNELDTAYQGAVIGASTGDASFTKVADYAKTGTIDLGVADYAAATNGVTFKIVGKLNASTSYAEVTPVDLTLPAGVTATWTMDGKSCTAKSEDTSTALSVPTGADVTLTGGKFYVITSGTGTTDDDFTSADGGKVTVSAAAGAADKYYKVAQHVAIAGNATDKAQITATVEDSSTTGLHYVKATGTLKVTVTVGSGTEGTTNTSAQLTATNATVSSAYDTVKALYTYDAGSMTWDNTNANGGVITVEFTNGSADSADFSLTLTVSDTQ